MMMTESSPHYDYDLHYKAAIDHCNDGIRLMMSMSNEEKPNYKGAVLCFTNSLQITKQLSVRRDDKQQSLLLQQQQQQQLSSSVSSSSCTGGSGGAAELIALTEQQAKVQLQQSSLQSPSPAANNLLDLCMVESLTNVVVDNSNNNPNNHVVTTTIPEDSTNIPPSESPLFLYSQPIRPPSLSPREEEESMMNIDSSQQGQGQQGGESYYNLEVLSSIVIFNLALACQMLAASTSKNTEDSSSSYGYNYSKNTNNSSRKRRIMKLRQRSIKLYELLLSQPSSSSSLFTMVLMNNLGVIQMECGNHSASSMTYRTLIPLIDAHVSSSTSTDYSYLLIEQIMKNATSIIFFSNDIIKRPAPAA